MLTRTMEMRGLRTGLIIALVLLAWMTAAAGCGVGLAMLATKIAG